MTQSLSIGCMSQTWNRWKILSLVLIPLSLTACQSLPAPEKLPRTLTVTGRGVETIPATKARVSLGVEVGGKTAAQVQQEVAKRSDALVKLLKSRNVEKLQTTGISLNPTYSYQNSEQRLTGYTGTNTVSFQIATDKSGTLLDDAIKAGATRIDSISFVASESAISTAREQAIRKAADDAKKQASALLNSLNLTEREIVSLQINGTSPLEPVFTTRAENIYQSNRNVANTPVVGGEQPVEASVTLQIRY
jgi:uncharacterized protein YggE